MNRIGGLLLILKCAISFGLIALILWRAELGEIEAAVSNVHFAAVGAALCSMTVGVLLRSYRWRQILKVQGVRAPVLALMRFYYTSFFFNNLFLGTLGGDAFRTYCAVEYSGSTAASASSVIVDRAAGFLAAVILALGLGVGFAFASEQLVSLRLLIILAVFAGLLGMGFFAASSRRLIPLCARCLSPFPRAVKFVEEAIASFQLYRRRHGSLAVVLALSFLFHIVQGVSWYFFAQAADANVTFHEVLFISVVVGLVVMIPISLNGIGVQEGSLIFYLEKAGVAGPAALVIVVLARASLLLFSLVGGLLFFCCRRRSRRTAQRHQVEDQAVAWRVQRGAHR